VSSACQGGLDAVVANIDGDTGKLLWAQEIGGTNNEDCGALAVDSQSNTIVAGTYRFASEVRVGGLDPLPIVGVVGAAWLYVAKLDSTGKAVWAQSFGRNSQSVVPTAMIALGTDFILAGTTTSNSLDTQAQKGSDLGSTTFVARFDGDGNSKWIQGLGAGGGLQVTSISNVSDRILVAGNYLRGGTLGSAVLAAPAAYAGSGSFVAGYRGSYTGCGSFVAAWNRFRCAGHTGQSVRRCADRFCGASPPSAGRRGRGDRGRLRRSSS